MCMCVCVCMCMSVRRCVRRVRVRLSLCVRGHARIYASKYHGCEM